MKKRFTEQQIVAILKEGEAGVAAKEICRSKSDSVCFKYRSDIVDDVVVGEPR